MNFKILALCFCVLFGVVCSKAVEDNNTSPLSNQRASNKQPLLLKKLLAVYKDKDATTNRQLKFDKRSDVDIRLMEIVSKLEILDDYVTQMPGHGRFDFEEM
jgi:hypothetical protein